MRANVPVGLRSDRRGELEEGLVEFRRLAKCKVHESSCSCYISQAGPIGIGMAAPRIVNISPSIGSTYSLQYWVCHKLISKEVGLQFTHVLPRSKRMSYAVSES
jgi:hypothetical protein